MLAVGIGPIGPFEGIIILAIVVLIFGVGKLADVGGALGKSVREFRRAARAPDEPEEAQAPASTSMAAQTSAPSSTSCSNCGAQVNQQSKFCASCGSPIQAAVN